MFCPKCGNEIKDGESFCGKCGNKIGSRDIQKTYIKSEPNKVKELTVNIQLVSSIIGVVVFIVVLFSTGVIQSTFGIGTSEYKNIVNSYCKNIDSKINYDYDVTMSGDTVHIVARAKDKYTADMYGTSQIFTVNKSSKTIVSAPFEKREY